MLPPHVDGMNQNRVPREIVLHTESRTLEVVFSDGERFHLGWEYLRVFSPSKEVRARHGKERILVRNKANVVLTQVAPIGNYAVKLYFDDGHQSGLYDWGYLRELGEKYTENWQEHLQRLQAENGE